jgi:excisionase family DNA binding protein
MTKTRLAYSKKEAAAATSISVRSIDYLISKGKLKAVKIGRRIVIPARDLEKLIYNGSGPLKESSSVATAVEAGVS